MIVVDLNLLLYAVDRDAPNHAVSRRWLEATLSGSEPVGLSWSVLLGFLRLVTRPGILRRPLDSGSALDIVDAWITAPVTVIATPTAAHWGVLASLIRHAGTAGNLTTDAHLAALAIEHSATLCSADHDFLRFPGLRFLNPLAPQR